MHNIYIREKLQDLNVVIAKIIGDYFSFKKQNFNVAL